MKKILKFIFIDEDLGFCKPLINRDDVLGNTPHIEIYLEETMIDPLTPPMQDSATQIGINHPSHSGNVRLATSIATASELKNSLNSNHFKTSFE